MFRQHYIYGTYCVALLLAILSSGCGSTKSRLATQQLLISDAVDRSIASIDFRPLAGHHVYLDTKYIKTVKGLGFVNSDYIISSLRQQMLAAECYLEEEREKAEFIAEVRVGALGTDAHDVTYGIPASNALSSAASLVPNAPPIPMIPEISLGKKSDEVAAAKIAVFAYYRESRHAFWQSGLAQAKSSSKDTWIFGAGPFQRGSLRRGTQFAGEDLGIPILTRGSDDEAEGQYEQFVGQRTFADRAVADLAAEPPKTPVQPVSQQVPSKDPADKQAQSPAKPPVKSAAKPSPKTPEPTTKR